MELTGMEDLVSDPIAISDCPMSATPNPTGMEPVAPATIQGGSTGATTGTTGALLPTAACSSTDDQSHNIYVNHITSPPIPC